MKPYSFQHSWAHSASFFVELVNLLGCCMGSLSSTIGLKKMTAKPARQYAPSWKDEHFAFSRLFRWKTRGDVGYVYGSLAARSDLSVVCEFVPWPPHIMLCQSNSRGKNMVTCAVILNTWRPKPQQYLHLAAKHCKACWISSRGDLGAASRAFKSSNQPSHQSRGKISLERRAPLLRAAAVRSLWRDSEAPCESSFPSHRHGDWGTEGAGGNSEAESFQEIGKRLASLHVFVLFQGFQLKWKFPIFRGPSHRSGDPCTSRAAEPFLAATSPRGLGENLCGRHGEHRKYQTAGWPGQVEMWGMKQLTLAYWRCHSGGHMPGLPGSLSCVSCRDHQFCMGCLRCGGFECLGFDEVHQ